MNKIGIVGIGLMGHPMALRWLKDGYEVQIYVSKSHQRSPSRATQKRIADLKSKGALIQRNLEVFCSQTDVIILMLPSSKEVEPLCQEISKLKMIRSRHLILIDMSTSDPNSTRRMGELFKKGPIKFFDAPVTGGVKGAENGTLTLFVGGDVRVYKKVKNILSSVSCHQEHFGKLGQGHVAKIINNTICIGNLAVLAEALALAKAQNLSSPKLFKTLLRGTAQSRMLEIYGPEIINKEFKPKFKLNLAHKDMRLAKGLSTSTKELSVITGVLRAFEEAEAQGLGELNLSALCLPIFKKLALK